MSIFGALNSSVTGLRAQSDALGVISDNISNVNTTGYKANTASFSNLVTAAATETSYNPGGVALRPGQDVQQQGILDSSDISTDLAIEGNGMFAVKDGGGIAGDEDEIQEQVDATPVKYTRTGNFRVNENGNLENANGFLLQGWRLSENDAGELTPPPDQDSKASLETVEVDNFSGIARATENLSVGAQLPPNLPTNETRSLTAQIFDAEGTPHNMQFNFSRTDGKGNELAENRFRVEINAPTRSDDETGEHAGMFTNGTVDTAQINRNSSSAISTILEEIKNEAASNPTNGGATGNTITFTLNGVEMELEDTSGTNFGGASNSPDVSNVTVADINGVENALELRVTSGNGSTLNDQASGETFDDISLTDLVEATEVGDVGTDGNAVNITTEGGNNTRANINLLGTSVQTVVSANPDGGNLALQTSGGNDTGLTLNDQVDSLAVNRDGDAKIGEKDDLVLQGTTDGQNFEKTSRVATIVEFKDGGIESIGDADDHSDLVAADTPFLAGDAQGQLDLGLDFQKRDLAVPDGTNATEPQNITLDLGTPLDADLDENGEIEAAERGVNDKQLDGLTSFENDEGFDVRKLEQDGLQFGNFTGVSVNESGTVTAEFSNGERRDVFQIPVVTFNNVNGLESQSGTVFAETPESGEAQLQEAGIGGAGSIAPSALESSTVDLATQFTKMIETQRAYSASTRVVTTSDEMLQTITNATR